MNLWDIYSIVFHVFCGACETVVDEIRTCSLKSVTHEVVYHLYV